MEPGIYDGIPNADYHKDPALGSSSLKTLATRTPAHWHWESRHPRTSDAFDLGTLFHSIVLEGDEAGVMVVDHENWMTKAAKEDKANARAEGKVPLLRKDWAQVKSMRDATMAHPLASKALTGHRAEASVFWEEDGLPLKCRPDAWNLGMLFDLKSTINADPREFGRTAHTYGYHQSHAHYQDGVEAATGERLPFVFINVEKHPPYLVSVVELDSEAVDLGRRLNNLAKTVYRKCADSGEWPGYQTTEPIRVPAWAERTTQEILNEF